MINSIMKKSGDKSYSRDIERLDRSAVSEEITIISNVNYITVKVSMSNRRLLIHLFRKRMIIL